MDVISYSSDEEEYLNVGNKKTYRARINFTTFNSSEFIERFRLRPSEAESVLCVIGPHKTDKNMALSPQQQFLAALHWFALGTTLTGISDMDGLSKATVCRVIKRVVKLIVNKMSSQVIAWPHDSSTIALEFIRKGEFPSVCGAVDGTLVNLIAPAQYEEQYVNRHGKHSLNVMLICGPDYVFYNVNSRFPGSVRDSRVLRASRITEKFENGWRPFPGAVLLGDSGYGLKSWLIPPLRSNPNDPQEQRFNVAHKRTRQIIENAIGILKNRFMRLKYLRMGPEFAALVVMACATLHNVARKGDFLVDQDEEDEADEGGNDGATNDPAGIGKLAELLAFF